MLSKTHSQISEVLHVNVPQALFMEETVNVSREKLKANVDEMRTVGSLKFATLELASMLVLSLNAHLMLLARQLYMIFNVLASQVSLGMERLHVIEVSCLLLLHQS